MMRQLNKLTRFRLMIAGAVAVPLLLGGCASAGGMGGGKLSSQPSVGLGAYTKQHSRFPEPPDRIGGPVTITAIQESGSTRQTLPGPRSIDPAVFGSGLGSTAASLKSIAAGRLSSIRASTSWMTLNSSLTASRPSRVRM